MVLSVVKYPIFCFNELNNIFHAGENINFPTFSWLFEPFPNPSLLCQPIPYLYKALTNLHLIPDFFKIFPTRGNPVTSDNKCGPFIRCVMIWIIVWIWFIFGVVVIGCLRKRRKYEVIYWDSMQTAIKVST